jgi:hypothetical protein
MTEAARPQKIIFAEMRDMGVHDILVYCADYHLYEASRVKRLFVINSFSFLPFQEGSRERKSALMARTAPLAWPR